MTSTYNRRQFLAQSAAVAGGAVVAGAAADFAGAMPAGAVTKGGTLTVGVISEQARPFLPAQAHMDTSGFNYARLVYDPLCVVSSNGKTVYPYLCQSLTHDSGYKNWTIKARAGVKFHDGNKCDANAIYQNLVACYKSLLTGTAIKSLISGFTLNAAAQTVTVHCKYKWVSFPYTLAEQQIGFIASPAVLSSTSPSTPPIGTGPFVFDNWVYGTSFTVLKNTQYWRAGFPYLDSVVMKPIPDSTSRYQALLNGNVDMVIEAEGPAIKTMKGSSFSGYQTWFDGPTGVPVWAPSCNCIQLNLGAAPFQGAAGSHGANLRKACALAINQALYVSVIDDGESAPINGIFLKGSPYYKTPPYPAYTGSSSVTSAKNIVKGLPASYKSFTLQYVTGDPTILSAAQFIQSQLNNIGLTVTLNGVLQSTLINNALSGKFQAMTWSQFGGVSPDLNYPWFSTKTNNAIFHLNFPQNMDPVIQTNMLAGMAATTTTARTKAWAAVNTQLGKDIPYLWTDRTVGGVASTMAVQGWKSALDPSGHAVLCPNQLVFFYHQIWKS